MKPVWIVAATYKKDYQVHLTFNDGTEGVVDLARSLEGPIFEPLVDKEFFKSFQLNAWTLEWPNGADFAPEYLYGKVQQLEKVG